MTIAQKHPQQLAVRTKLRRKVGEDDEWSVYIDEPSVNETFLQQILKRKNFSFSEISVRGRIARTTRITFDEAETLMRNSEIFHERVLFRRRTSKDCRGDIRYGQWIMSKEGGTKLPDFGKEKFKTWKRYW